MSWKNNSAESVVATATSSTLGHNNIWTSNDHLPTFLFACRFYVKSNITHKTWLRFAVDLSPISPTKCWLMLWCNFHFNSIATSIIECTQKKNTRRAPARAGFESDFLSMKSNSRAPSNSDCFQLTSIGPNLRLRHILVQWKFFLFSFFFFSSHLVVMLNSFNGHSFSFELKFTSVDAAFLFCVESRCRSANVNTSLTVVRNIISLVMNQTQKNVYSASQGRLTIFFFLQYFFSV